MIPAERSHLHAAAQTHPGMSGKNNEDRYAISAYRLEGEDALPVVLTVVADGIGGHRAGEVAAEMAVETVSQIGDGETDARIEKPESHPPKKAKLGIRETELKLDGLQQDGKDVAVDPTADTHRD